MRRRSFFFPREGRSPPEELIFAGKAVVVVGNQGKITASRVNRRTVPVIALAGKLAAAVTEGVQRHSGCGTTVKHFAANNQETNRYNSNSQVSERALRELYLRGFELAIRNSQPKALMTSYNLINGVHSSERRDLLEDVLRAEFGYQGIVMTDWILAVMNGRGNKYPAPIAARIAAAGNDLTMPGGQGDLKAMLKGLEDGLVTRRQLQLNATRVLRMAKQLTTVIARESLAGK